MSKEFVDFDVIKNKLDNIRKNVYFQDKINILMFVFSLLLNLGIWLSLYLKIRPVEYLIPLHFNIYFGIDFIDKWTKVFTIPILGLIFIFINFFLSYILYSQEKILSHLLNTAAVFIQCLLILAGIGVIILQQ